eukprot:364170-Chlamydomonas_euryale.AAC.14
MAAPCGGNSVLPVRPLPSPPAPCSVMPNAHLFGLRLHLRCVLLSRFRRAHRKLYPRLDVLHQLATTRQPARVRARASRKRPMWVCFPSTSTTSERLGNRNHAAPPCIQGCPRKAGAANSARWHNPRQLCLPCRKDRMPKKGWCRKQRTLAQPAAALPACRAGRTERTSAPPTASRLCTNLSLGLVALQACIRHLCLLPWLALAGCCEACLAG